MSAIRHRWGWTEEAAAVQVDVRMELLTFDRVLVAGPGGDEILYPTEFLALPIDQRIRMSFEKRVRFMKGDRAVPSREAMSSLLAASRQHSPG